MGLGVLDARDGGFEGKGICRTFHLIIYSCNCAGEGGEGRIAALT